MNIRIKNNIIEITSGEHFAIISRKSKKGYYSITTSFLINGEIADILDRSKILEVYEYSADGSIVFKRLDFYSQELLIDLFIDLFENHSNKIKKHG